MKSDNIRIWLKDTKKMSDDKPDLEYKDMEWFKEEHGIKIVHVGVFPNINSHGTVELFIPYSSILYMDVRSIL